MSEFDSKPDLFTDEDVAEHGVEHGEDNFVDSDDMQQPFNPADINVVPKQDTLRNLIDRLHDGAIDMHTDFQRYADLWDPHKMSRLIESILIRFPLPAFYFDASDDDKWLIVDGLQRLSAIKKFVIDGGLKLQSLEYLQDIKGCSYEELSRSYKRRINECPITLFLIQKGTPEAVKYSIFRRINTGGLVLNDQEIRNAMIKQKTRNYLKELVEDKFFEKAFGRQSRRMVDQEMVLRYLAFRFMDYEDTKKGLASFLDEMIERLDTSTDSELKKYKTSFHLAIRRCWEIFGERAFEKSGRDGDQAKRRRKNSALYVIWMNALGRIEDNQMQQLLDKKEELVQKHQDLMKEDVDYFQAISQSTQKKGNYRIRRDRVQELIREILDD